MKIKLSDMLVFVLLFIFVIAFPVDLFPISAFYKLLIQICLRLLILIYYIYIIVVNKINIFKFFNWKRLALFTPFLLASFSNLIASGIDGGFGGYITMDDGYFFLLIIFHFVVAVIEEILFRLFIHSSLVNVGSLKRIFASAGIFALMHLLNIVNISTVDGLVTVLVQVVYNFGLGILLGFIYEYSYSLLGCIFMHFSFNFFNTVLYEYLSCTCSTLVFYLTAFTIAVLLAVYTFLVYRFILKRNDRYFRE